MSFIRHENARHVTLLVFSFGLSQSKESTLGLDDHGLGAGCRDADGRKCEQPICGMVRTGLDLGPDNRRIEMRSVALKVQTTLCLHCALEVPCALCPATLLLSEKQTVLSGELASLSLSLSLCLFVSVFVTK